MFVDQMESHLWPSMLIYLDASVVVTENMEHCYYPGGYNKKDNNQSRIKGLG
jgi:hypothetical protein